MAAKNDNLSEEEMPVTVTGEPTDQLIPEEDLDETENDDEPYEGIRHEDDEDDDMIDDNMTGMPVVPSPS